MQSWKKIREDIAYDGWRQIIHRYFIMPNGEEMRFDVIGNNPFVTVAAVTDEMEFILVKQFRPGPESFLISFPEGYIDSEESPEQSAARELLEETGYAAKSFHFLKQTGSAYSTETRYSILAKGCQKVADQNLDPSEYIEVFKMPLADFRQFLKDPESPMFTNTGTAYLALEYLGFL